MTAMIYHMCPAEAWEEAVAAGRYTGTEDDRRDGFIHFSTAAQIAESARRHRAGQAGLVLVAVEAARLGDRLRWDGRRMIAKSVLIACAAVLLLGGFAYAGLCLWFAVNERSLVFYPMARASIAPQAAGLTGVAEITIATEDGERLYGWWAPPQPGHGAVVYFVGKGLVLSDGAGLFGDLAEHGFGVLGIDYRGNGASTGRPSESGLRADARAAFDFVREAAPQARVVAFGESLGTGVAVGLAHDRPVAGVLLNSPYASIVRLFELRGMPLPYRLLMADPLGSEALIGGLR